MQKIKIICIGKYKEIEYVSLEKMYLKRINPYIKLEIIEIKEFGYKKYDNLNLVKIREGEQLLKYLKPDDFVIALDENGKLHSSRQFSDMLQSKSLIFSSMTFIIGGSLGLDGTILERANVILSLSRMTLLHNMARLVLMEQIYRAITLSKNIPYHK